MTCKATVTVIARHELLPADGGSARTAGWASSAGNHGGNNHGSPEPTTGVFADCDDPPGDFVPQDKWKGMARWHTIERKPDIGVTDAAARNLDNNFVRARIKNRKFARLQGSVGSVQLESVGPLNTGYHGPLRVPEAIAVLRGTKGRSSRHGVTAVTW
jgi:hypothetical protein